VTAPADPAAPALDLDGYVDAAAQVERHCDRLDDAGLSTGASTRQVRGCCGAIRTLVAEARRMHAERDALRAVAAAALALFDGYGAAGLSAEDDTGRSRCVACGEIPAGRDGADGHAADCRAVRLWRAVAALDGGGRAAGDGR
jgi:hypothetical protein